MYDQQINILVSVTVIFSLHWDIILYHGFIKSKELGNVLCIGHYSFILDLNKDLEMTESCLIAF